MDTQLIELFKVLGVTSIAFIIWLIIKEIGIIVKNKNNSPADLNGRVQELEKLMNNDYQHELENVWNEIRALRANDDALKNQINEIKIRLAKLEK